MTISRFARILGYDAYRDFKIDLGKDLQATRGGFGEIYQVVASSDSDDAVIEKVFQGNIASLDNTLKILNRRDLIRAAEILSHAQRVVFFGIGGSGHIAHDAALQFHHLEIQVDAYSDSYQMLSQSFCMKRSSEVAVGISHSGRSAVTVQSLRIAQANGAMTIGISNYPQSPLHEASRIFFCTSFPESQSKVAALFARMPRRA